MAKQSYSNQEIEDSIKSILWKTNEMTNASSPSGGATQRHGVRDRSDGADSRRVPPLIERRRNRKSSNNGGNEQNDSDAATLAKKKKKKKKPKKKKGDDENGADNENQNNPRSKRNNSRDRRQRRGHRNMDENQKLAEEEKLLQQIPSMLIDDPRPSDEVLADLERERLFPLRRKSLKFPLARFFCRLCDYHCDTVSICYKHIKDTRHKRLKLIRTTDILLKSLPPPSDPHLESLTKLVETVYAQQVLPEEQIVIRKEIFEKVSEHVHSKFPDAKLTIYGSTATGFALKDSDLNIDLTVNEESAKMLMAVHLMLKDDESGYYHQVQSDFNAKIPCVYFNVSGSDTRCQLSINSQIAGQTGELLSCYTGLDPRVRKIGVVFRYWAKVINIDQQDRGTLPSYVFGLMVIYFMQQCQPPVLPVLHELEPEDEKSRETSMKSVEYVQKLWKAENNMSVGELWLNLLKFYSVDLDLNKIVICIRRKQPVPRDEKKWASKKLAIEDPYAKKRNVARSVSHSHVFEYIYDRLRAAFLYFGIPQTKDGPLFTNVDSSKLEDKLRDKYKRLDQEANQIKTSGSPVAEEVSPTPETDVSMTLNRESESCSSPEKELPETPSQPRLGSDNYSETLMQRTKKLVNEKDDFIDKFAEILVEDIIQRSLDQIQGLKQQQCFKGVPSDELNNVDDEQGQELLVKAVEQMSLAPEDTDVNEKNDKEDSVIASESESEVSGNESENQSDEEDEFKTPTGSIGRDRNDSLAKESDLADPDDGIVKDLYDNKLALSLRQEDLIFRFDKEVLSDGKGPAVMCSICQTEGHLKQNCPEENLPELKPLPPMTTKFRSLLENILFQIPGDFEPKHWERKSRTSIIKELQEFIRDDFPDARLKLFGSSVNGFGFRQSDMDICMTFDGEAFDDLPHVEIIDKLAKKLRHNKSLYDVIPIGTAKVPIVKFKHRRSRLEGDISLYNTLAQHNTEMLQLYSEIDFRVKVLGYTMKVFAKICDMCDASRGSLSSYAYILMVLYFLQQRKPPVIPVLQELYEDEEKPSLMIDGWNAWFFRDVDNLKSTWKDFGKNKESLADLWLGMMRFYTEEFNFKDYVISIRQLAPLTRFEKLWNGKCLAIEDPFDLNHNLGAGVSRKMNMYIMKAFINARAVFGTPVIEIPERYPQIQDYLFDKNLLTDSEPPNDRGCRICGKIGHFAKECPRTAARKERQMRDREHAKEERVRKEQNKSAERHLSGSTPMGQQDQRHPGGGQQHQQGARNKHQHQRPHGAGRGNRPRASDSVGSGGHTNYGSPRRSHSPVVYYNSTLQDAHIQRQTQPCDGMAFLNNFMDMTSAGFTWQQEKFLPSQQNTAGAMGASGASAPLKPNSALKMLPGHRTHHHQSHLASASSQSHHPIHHPISSMPRYQHNQHQQHQMQHHQHKAVGAVGEHPSWLAPARGQSFIHQNSPPHHGHHNAPNQHIHKYQKEETPGGFTWQQQAIFMNSESMGQNTPPHRRQQQPHAQGQIGHSNPRHISHGRNIEVTDYNDYYSNEGGAAGGGGGGGGGRGGRGGGGGRGRGGGRGGGGHRPQSGGADYGNSRQSGHYGNQSQRYQDSRNYQR